MGRYTMHSLPRIFTIFVALAACATLSAQSSKYEGIGKPAPAEDIAKWDYSINPVTMQELHSRKGNCQRRAPPSSLPSALCVMAPPGRKAASSVLAS